MIESGEELRDGRPPEDWTRQWDPYSQDVTVGHHKGEYESLNVTNAQPGYRYYYELNNPNALLTKLNRGWEVVNDSDPERFGSDRLPEGVQQQSGGPRAFQDVILMRIPEEIYNGQRQEQRRQYVDKLDGIVQDYMDHDPGMERGSRPSRYKQPDHGITEEDL